MVGAKTPPNIPEPRQGIQTLTLRKQAGKWLIAAFQNTNAVPETPFPKGPPAAPPGPSGTPWNRSRRQAKPLCAESSGTCAGELIVCDFGKAYSGFLIACW